MMSPQYILSEGITDKVEVGMTGFGAKHSYMSVGNAAAVYQDVVMQVRGLIMKKWLFLSTIMLQHTVYKLSKLFTHHKCCLK